MDKLEKKVTDSKKLYSMSQEEVEFTYWSKMSYWSHDEAVALLLERDPKIINLSGETKWPSHIKKSELVDEYLRLKDLIVRAFEMQELEEKNTPETFLEWADCKGIEVPEALRQAVSTNGNTTVNSMTKAEMESLLKTKEEEIAVLRKQIDELKTVVWDGFDENIGTYSKELAIAVRAHAVVSKNWKKGKSIKQQITLWLENNHPKLANEERERIAKICNWQKSGGVPSTP